MLRFFVLQKAGALRIYERVFFMLLIGNHYFKKTGLRILFLLDEWK